MVRFVASPGDKIGFAAFYRLKSRFPIGILLDFQRNI